MTLTVSSRDPVRVARQRRDFFIANAFSDGLSLRKIGDLVGLSPARVYSITKRLFPSGRPGAHKVSAQVVNAPEFSSPGRN